MLAPHAATLRLFDLRLTLDQVVGTACAHTGGGLFSLQPRGVAQPTECGTPGRLLDWRAANSWWLSTESGYGDSLTCMYNMKLTLW